jgi:hypothetical protein
MHRLTKQLFIKYFKNKYNLKVFENNLNYLISLLFRVSVPSLAL